MLFGMFDFDAGASESLDQLAARQNIPTREWLNQRAQYVFEFYTHLFQSLAARVETWLAPGTVLEPDGDILYLSAFLFNPAGESVGRQRRLHPTPQELGWGVAPGDTLRVLETEIGGFALLVGQDLSHPETIKALASSGADVLLQPAADISSTHNQTAGELQRVVQVHKIFGARAALVGGRFSGSTAIYAPSELTTDESVVIAQGRSDSADEVILADMDLEELERLRAVLPPD
jgi:formamidase